MASTLRFNRVYILNVISFALNLVVSTCLCNRVVNYLIVFTFVCNRVLFNKTYNRDDGRTDKNIRVTDY